MAETVVLALAVLILAGGVFGLGLIVGRYPRSHGGGMPYDPPRGGSDA